MDDAYNVTADELRQFVERYEEQQAEKDAVAETMKETLAELKGHGYDVAAFKKVIALRKLTADAIAEQEAIEALYRSALGMP